MSNYFPPSSKKTNTYCTVCNQLSKLTNTCFYCGNRVCMNTCSYMVLPQDIENKPWMSQAVGKNVCLNCLPKTTTASDDYIRTIFAKIFEPEIDQTNIDRDEVIENTIRLQNDIDIEDKKPPQNQEKLLDNFIGAILSNLADHNNIKFDENGNLSYETVRNFLNNVEQNLTLSLIS